MGNLLLFIATFFAFFIAPSIAVKIRTFYVPGKAGNEAPLLCTYDLEEDTLYDVKWYKDGEQFFRCEPNGVTTAFDVDGVKVQHVKFAPLGSCSLTLMMLTKKTGGEYKCEVNTEGPKFDTASESKKLMIIEPTRKRLPNNATITTVVSNNTVVQYQQNRENEIVYGASSSIQGNFSLYAMCCTIFALLKYNH